MPVKFNQMGNNDEVKFADIKGRFLPSVEMTLCRAIWGGKKAASPLFSLLQLQSARHFEWNEKSHPSLCNVHFYKFSR